MSLNSPVVEEAAVARRDPEVSELTFDSIKLISTADRLLDDLTAHHHEMEEFLLHASEFVERREHAARIRRVEGGRRTTDPQ
jgi:hypothetical protein